MVRGGVIISIMEIEVGQNTARECAKHPIDPRTVRSQKVPGTKKNWLSIYILLFHIIFIFMVLGIKPRTLRVLR